ncbi:MAG: hypothetical protein ACI377_10385, partial [Bacteroides fragilis]
TCYEALYQFPPLCSSAAGILLRVSCIFVADGAKTEPKAEDLLEVEPLVRRVLAMVLRVSSCALFIVLPRKGLHHRKNLDTDDNYETIDARLLGQFPGIALAVVEKR